MEETTIWVKIFTQYPVKARFWGEGNSPMKPTMSVL
jgi:hypothetical protein